MDHGPNKISLFLFFFHSKKESSTDILDTFEYGPVATDLLLNATALRLAAFMAAFNAYESLYASASSQSGGGSAAMVERRRPVEEVGCVPVGRQDVVVVAIKKQVEVLWWCICSSHGLVRRMGCR